MIWWWLPLVILITWLIIRYNKNVERKNSSPIDIAKERLAKGEISTEEFESILKKLNE